MRLRAATSRGEGGRRGGRRALTLGWSRTTVVVEEEGPILDLGSGAFPNAGADILCDGSLEDSRHRHGLAAVIDRPMVVARAEALPFRDGAFAFLIASHIAEHVEDPAGFCREMRRVARAGYIETPSPLADRLLEEEYHLWRVGSAGGRLTFTRKSPADRRPRRLTEAFYRIYNTGEACARPTPRLPRGPVGRALGLVLLVMRAALNRTGLMHTRHRFGPEAPLDWHVDEGDRPAVTFISRPPRSGFLDADRRALADRFAVREIVYPGRPSPWFLWEVLKAARATAGVYGFFASEHMLLPALAFRLAGKPVLVTVGGYDIAADRAHGYGLAASRWQRWLPATVLRLADVVLPFSEAAAAELAAGFPGAVAKAHTVRLGVDTAAWRAPAVRPERSGVVTVGYVSEESWSRKGIDRFVALARSDPGQRYVLAGRVDPAVADRLLPVPPNLEVTGYLSPEALTRVLWSSAVYAQLSWHEAFGVSLLEAMACGCVPVVTTVPALVEVAGAWAETVPVDEPSGDLAAVRRALARSAEVDVDRLRAWVDERFAGATRAERLTGLIARQVAGVTEPTAATPIDA